MVARQSALDLLELTRKFRSRLKSSTARTYLPYLILAPITLAATYLIYRNTSARLRAKTDEITALGNLHLATAEALATAIDAKDQTTHCHVRRVQIYAAGMGEVFGLTLNEIAALKAGALLARHRQTRRAAAYFEQAWSTDAG